MINILFVITPARHGAGSNPGTTCHWIASQFLLAMTICRHCERSEAIQKFAKKYGEAIRLLQLLNYK